MKRSSILGEALRRLFRIPPKRIDTGTELEELRALANRVLTPSLFGLRPGPHRALAGRFFHLDRALKAGAPLPKEWRARWERRGRLHRRFEGRECALELEVRERPGNADPAERFSVTLLRRQRRGVFVRREPILTLRATEALYLGCMFDQALPLVQTLVNEGFGSEEPVAPPHQPQRPRQ